MISCASAYSTANRAGWARSVGSRLSPVEHLCLAGRCPVRRRIRRRSDRSSPGTPARCRRDRGPCRRAGHPARGTGTRDPLCARRAPAGHWPIETFSCSAALSTAQASARSATTAAIRTSCGRRPARVNATSASASCSSRDSSAASAALASCSDSAVRADNSSTWGPLGATPAEELGSLLDHDVDVGATDTEGAHPGASQVRRTPTAGRCCETTNGVFSRCSSGLGAVKCTVGGIALFLRHRIVLTSPATPEAASRCPMFDFTEPSTHGPGRSSSESSKACRRASISMGSPSGVPVPWVSTNPMVEASTSATACASAMTSACPATAGAA